jgi:hypothetical protein
MISEQEAYPAPLSSEDRYLSYLTGTVADLNGGICVIEFVRTAGKTPLLNCHNSGGVLVPISGRLDDGSS